MLKITPRTAASPVKEEILIIIRSNFPTAAHKLNKFTVIEVKHFTSFILNVVMIKSMIGMTISLDRAIMTGIC